MKLIYYCSDFYPLETGYSLAFQNFIKIASKIDYIDTIIVVTSTYNNVKELNIEKVKIIRPEKKLNNKIARIVYFIFNALKTKKSNFDLVIVETFDYALVTHFLTKEQRKQTVIRVHGTSETEYTWYFPGLAYKISRIIQKSLLKRGVSHLWATTNYYIDYYQNVFYRHNSYQTSKVYFETMPNPVPDIRLLETIESKNDEYEYDFLVLGRMDKRGVIQKGFDTLATALVLLKKNYNEKFSVLWIGTGDCKDSIRDYLYQHGLKEYVEFKDNLSNPDIHSKLEKSKWVILNSRFEGASMFALEALAFRKPVITTCAGGLADYYNGRNGLKIKDQTPAAVFDALICALHVDNDVYEEFIEENKLLSEKYDSKKIRERLTLRLVSIVESFVI